MQCVLVSWRRIMIMNKLDKLRILKNNFGLQYTINYMNAYIYANFQKENIAV